MVTKDSFEDQNEINCHESIFSWIFCLLSMAGEHYYFMSHSNPRWCNKISKRWNGEKWIFETKIFCSLAFFTWTKHETRERWKQCKWFFFGDSRLMETASTVSISYSREKYMHITQMRNARLPSRSSIVRLFCWSPESKGEATDMQRNHAGSSFKINYVWLKRPAKD